jgi:thioredoxin reductase (NADPH)
MVHRGSAIHPHVKYWIKPNIENRIKNGEIKGYFNTRVMKIREDSVLLSTSDGEVEVKNDFVFAMVGYSPDLTFLNAAGITLEAHTRKPRTNPDTLESSRAGVYLAGVIVAGMHTNEIFIENGRFHGRQIASAIQRALQQD